ncbi:HlyD family efflux transporter periplasmic adaptor subunit [Castellaniella hirudinis]|uniref:HlyD family efflux transporter periplasmic adaptor subunit n=1 Tax=Castellaniella hirudinis TaxID=1144617 RepID=A0ABV8S094_9BURK
MTAPAPHTGGQAALPPLIVQPGAELARLDEIDDFHASGAIRVTWIVAAFLAIVFAWAWTFSIDEVSTGTGKVIPSSREQEIKSLEGGILSQLNVQVGDLVEKEQELARLDPTRGESLVGETAAQYRAALASQARLRAEVDDLETIVFPPELDEYLQLREEQLALFRSRRDGLKKTLKGLDDALGLVRREVGITSSLVKTGAASTVELIRLQRQQADLELKITETRSHYIVQSRQELAQVGAQVKSLSSVVRGREDTLNRTLLRSPVRGIVKRVDVTTLGGVVPPNGAVMTIVPLDSQLLVEARISPRDIAFIHPDQEALVKVTAYDYAIYGGLPGRVVTISPDTVRDEVRPEIVYYPVYVRTESNALVNQAGREFPIVPGMITTADIRTGDKTVWDYLTKPFNKAREALRER